MPYSDQITEVVKDLAAAGARRSRRCSPVATRSAPRPTWSSAPTAACAAATTPVSSAPPRARSKPTCWPARTTRSSPVGRKAEGYFRFRGYTLATTFAGFSDNPTYAHAKQIGEYVVDLYTSGAVDRVELVYTRFISAGSQEVVLRPLVPLDRETVAGGDGKAPDAAGTPADFEFEPDPGTILDTLLPRYVEARIYAALLNAAASEHAFRQRAMKSATDNAEELIKNLSRIMNRARQDSITTEIMEIVSGAEALGGEAKVRLIDFGPISELGLGGEAQPVARATAASSGAIGVLAADDLEVIEGIGPVINGQLRAMGITTFAQVAAWTTADAERIGAELDFPGRIEREQWIDQARQLLAEQQPSSQQTRPLSHPYR